MNPRFADHDAPVNFESLTAYLQGVFTALPTSLPSSIPVLSLHQIRHLSHSSPHSNHDRQAQYAHLLLLRHHLTERMCQLSDLLRTQGVHYAISPELVLQRAEVYEALGYADLAVADAYAAFTVAVGEEEDLRAVGTDGRLWDEESEDGEDEEEEEQDDVEEDNSEESSHEEASESGDEGSAIEDRDRQCRKEDVGKKRVVAKRDALRLMIRGLTDLGCTGELPRWQSLLREAEEEIRTKHNINENDEDPGRWTIYDNVNIAEVNGAAVIDGLVSHEDGKQKGALFGFSRRERYPWNEHEPDRMGEDSLKKLSFRVFEASNGCLEVRKTFLPQLKPSASDSANDMTRQRHSTEYRGNPQLGLFALRDLHPSETILHEHSVLTAIRPHDEPLCDACAVELPTSMSSSSTGSSTDALEQKLYACPGCAIPFCSPTCLSTALSTYHIPNIDDTATESGYPPAASPFCPGKTAHADVHELGRAESSVEPEWDLYSLLIARCIMMAETRAKNPLAMEEVMWLWGELLPPLEVDANECGDGEQTNQPAGSTSNGNGKIKRTLPYSIHHSLLLPFEFFTTLLLSVPDCAPYSSHWLRNYDWWILQTLYAKFRGVADARQSTWDGKPESAGVFGLWSLANHSCGGNVEWESRRGADGRGGERVFEVREEVWTPSRKKDDGVKGEETKWRGIKKGDEIWNHYTDTREEDFRIRRGRLREVLGGDCMCDRCVWEEGESKDKQARHGER